MPNSIANYGGIMIGLQTAKGTPVARTRALPYLGDPAYNVKDTTLLVQDSRVHQGYNAIADRASVDGNFESYLTPEDIGYLLHWFLGAPTTALHAGETIVYDHTFKPTANPDNQPYVTAEYINQNLTDSELAQDTRLESLDINWGNQGAVKAKAGWAGTKPSINTSATSLVYNNLTPLIFAHDLSQINSSTLKLQNVGLSMKSKTDKGDFIAGQLWPDDVPQGDLEFEVSVKAKYTDKSWMKLLFGSSSATAPALTVATLPIALDLKSNIGIGVGSFYELKVNLPKAFIADYKETRGVGSVRYVDMKLRGAFDPTASAGSQDALNAVLTNLKSSYATWP